MKQFAEFVPITVFFGVYFYTRDIFLSTGVLMAAMFLQLLFEFFTTGKVEKKTLIIFGIVVVLGSLTLFFQDETFLLWKPTIVNWLFCIVLLGSHLVSEKTLLEKMLGQQLTLPAPVWKNLSLGWSLGFFVAGAINLFVAYNYSLDTWVTYKLFGGFGISLIYMVIMMTYLVKGGYLKDVESSK
ncbi:MAG: intracellular septation protein [Candidatus Azotimanducaceae bacterium]|jgi:intracellular septation protein